MIIKINGMSCMNCVRHVKEALEELSGITNIEVDLENKQAVVQGTASEEAIRAVIDEAGYDVVEILA